MIDIDTKVACAHYVTGSSHSCDVSEWEGWSVTHLATCSTDRSRTPVAVVRRYVNEIYHDARTDLVREICADPVIRHDPGRRIELSHDDQIARIEADLPQWRPWFTANVLAGDDEHAVLVWTAEGRTADRLLTGIEVFRVRDGRITDVWNAPSSTERWG